MYALPCLLRPTAQAVLLWATIIRSSGYNCCRGLPSYSQRTVGLRKYIMHRWKESGRGAAVAVVVVLLAIGLRPVIVMIRRRGNEPRSGTLKIVSNPDDAKFEFVDSVGSRCRLH